MSLAAAWEKWAGTTGQEKGRRSRNKTPAPEKERHPGGTQRHPKPLTALCSFLDSGFIFRCIWSQAHQVKPGRNSTVSPEPQPAPGVQREKGVGCSSPILLTPHNTPQGFHPLWKTSPLPSKALTRKASPFSCSGLLGSGVCRENNLDVSGQQVAEGAHSCRTSLPKDRGRLGHPPSPPRTPYQSLTHEGKCTSRRGGGWRRELQPSCVWGERRTEKPEHLGMSMKMRDFPSRMLSFYAPTPWPQAAQPSQISSSTQNSLAGGRRAAISKQRGRTSCAGSSLLLLLYLTLSIKAALHTHSDTPSPPKDGKKYGTCLFVLKQKNQTHRG